MTTVPTTRRARFAAAVTAALVVPLASVPAASAATPAEVRGARAGASVPDHCDHAAHRRTVRAALARAHRADDQRDYSRRQMRRIDAALTAALRDRGIRPGTGPVLNLELRIPVHAHVINGRRTKGPSRERLLRQVDVLNAAFGGRTSRGSLDTRFRFYLASVDRVRNQRWYTAAMGDPADVQARRRLHRGGPEALNLYVAKPRSVFGGITLGWSSEPRLARRYPRLDGVTITKGSMPGGGRIRNYNRGDTAVHEVGHWLGLFHTFEGGCSTHNDLVADTPAEAFPAFGCPVGRDSCPLPGKDPVRNFMDYSFDRCMNRFTVGQASRMTRNWLAYRTP